MTISSTRVLTASALTLTAGLALSACKPSTPPAAPDTTITKEEVAAAEKAWGKALVDISLAYDTGGLPKAKPLASSVIDTAYGYNLGPVLFKPTLTREPQTFRLTKEGALSYFVGDDPNFPGDTGFALKHWRDVQVNDVGLQINGSVANTMGKVTFTDNKGCTTTVDKTWVFKKDEKNVVRIIVHHSSLPFGETGEPVCPKPGEAKVAAPAKPS
ncbi:MAG: hypothetical protein J7515_17850 [Caulobacter sp.]|nr:hypothetical protein [Caulobacter sp.]